MARPLKLPAPGTELGPCDGACEHRDCADHRKQAQSRCPLCGDPIGYETYFYYVGSHLEHAYCKQPNIYRKPEGV